MKKAFKFLLIALVFPALIFSQDLRENDNSKTKKESKIFSYERGVSDFLQLRQADANFSNNLVQNSNRSVVVIQQVGFDNRIISNTVSNGQSSISHFQSGTKNYIESSSLLDNVSEQIFQNGNNNKVTNFTFGNIDNASLNILQDGNNLTVEKFGVNSQTNKMSVRLLGNSQSVIIRSF